MRVDPVANFLAPSVYQVCVAAGAEHGDKDLGLFYFAGLGVGDPHGLTGVVDEHLFAGFVIVMKDNVSVFFPLAVVGAKTCALIQLLTFWLQLASTYV